MAGIFRRLDGQTPVTIGFAFESTMEKYVEDVDVLVFHNYLQTRAAVRADIKRAKKAAAAARKQVMDDEIGCVARANPYDVTIQEHMNARVGYYLWELMIVWDGERGWGNIHGIFYPDGTVRDPSIPMAVMGIFRNRGPEVVLEQPDREGRVTREIAGARRWLADPNARWDAGLDTAEAAANLPEKIRVGVINVSVAGCKIELFQKASYESYLSTQPAWMKNIVKQYDGSPYARLVELTKQAQADGVITGILLHQGESNSGDSEWPSKVKGVYDDLLKDLALEPNSVPLLAGELVAGPGVVARLPQAVPHSYVISSKGCTSQPDRLHFNSAGYRELGRRYGEKMLELLGCKIKQADPQPAAAQFPAQPVAP